MNAQDKQKQSGFTLILFVLAITSVLLTSATFLHFSLISQVDQNITVRSSLIKAQQVVRMTLAATLKNSVGLDHTINDSHNVGVFDCLRTGAYCPPTTAQIVVIRDSEGEILFQNPEQTSFDLKGKTCHHPGVWPCLLGLQIAWKPSCPYGCARPSLTLEMSFRSLDPKQGWNRKVTDNL